jgi:hypothetical protein
MENASTGRAARDSLSTVSTILGLVLFTILVITILVRRVIVNRHLRNMRTMRIARPVPPIGVGFDTRFGIINRGDVDMDSAGRFCALLMVLLFARALAEVSLM